MARRKKHYGNEPTQAPLLGLGFTAIIGLAIGIPLLLFGFGTVFKFFTSPIVNGQISVWWLLLGGLILALFMRNRRPTYQRPPGY